MRTLLAGAFAALLLVPHVAFAAPIEGHVAASCGAQTYTAGQSAQVTLLANGEVCTNAASSAGQQASSNSLSVVTSSDEPNIGIPGNTACATDTGSCTLNALLQRIAQRLTTVAGDIVSATTAPGQTTMSASIPMTIASDQSFASTYFLQPTASDNHTNVKNGAGTVHWILVENNSATVNYLRFYNAATGFNGCNSATNLVTQIQIPASTAVGGVNIPLVTGIPFSTGISICVTSGYATTDTTNATASAMSLTIGYN